MSDKNPLFVRLQGLDIQRLFRLLQSNLWGFADQALISGSNFVLMILLARRLGPDAFGTFVIGYSVLLIANSIQGALFTQPHNVVGATLTHRQFRDYTSALAFAQGVFSLTTGAFLVLTGVFLAGLVKEIVVFALALAIALIGWQFQEFIRRMNYTAGNQKAAFINDLASYGGQLLLIVGLWQLDELDEVTALLAIGLACLSGAALGYYRARDKILRRTNLIEARTTFTANWKYARWLLGSAISSALSSQLYPLLVAGFIGSAATGGMRAAQTFMGPINILMMGLETIALPKVSRGFNQDGPRGAIRAVMGIGGGVGVIAFLYCIAVTALATPLVELFLGSDYSDYAWIVQAYGLYYALSYVSMVVSVALRGMGASFPIFLSRAVSAVLTLTLGVLAVASLGLAGAVAGLILTSVVVNVIQGIYIGKSLNNDLSRSGSTRL